MICSFWTNNFYTNRDDEIDSAVLLGNTLDGFAIKEKRSVDMEQLNKDEMEDQKTFVVKSVVNPVDGCEISFQQAIASGVIRPTEGVYFNSVTGATMPLATAMMQDLVKIVFASPTKTSEMKKTSVGIITVKTTRTGSTPEVVQTMYAVRAVVDRWMKTTITFQEAVQSGIIDRTAGTYRDNVADETMSVEVAIKRGFLKARVIDDDSGLDIDPLNRMVVERTDKIRRQIVIPLGVIGAFKISGKDDVEK